MSTDYDPAIVYHSQSSDLPLLSEWVSELIHITDESLPLKTHPTTEQLVSALQRYDAVLRELLRQMRIHSEPISRIFSKVWVGVLKMLDYMVKSYHRYVKHTSHLQDQAHHLMRQRTGQDVAKKVREEEFDLERTVLLAKIRILESESESLKREQLQMSRENAKLRSVVSAYINSAKVSEGTWDEMEAEDPMSTAQILTTEKARFGISDQKFKRKDSVDAGIEQLRKLGHLEVEMDKVLANVLKEEDRQRLIVADLMKLMKKNKDISAKGRNIKDGGNRAAVNTMADASVQVDRRDFFGVVQDLVVFEKFQDQEISAPDAPPNAKVRGADVPFQLRKYMRAFSRVVRIPPAAWLCQTIMAIYFAKIREDDELKGQGLCSSGMADHIHSYYTKTLGVDAVVDSQIMQLLVACEHYVSKLPRVAIFGSQIGLFRKEDAPDMDCRDGDFLLDIFRSLLRQRQLQEYRAAIDNKKKPKKKPSGTPQPQDDTNDELWSGFEMTVHSQVLRSAAIVTVQESIGRFLPDGGQDYIMKVRAMAHSERGAKYVDLDELIEIVMEPWQIIRGHWEEHARFIFQQNCNVHKVLSEVQFATDTGVRNRDTILMQVQKTSAADCRRRSVRAFQKQLKDVGKPATASKGPKDDKGGKQAADIEKEPVCETMTRSVFAQSVKMIDPSLTASKIDQMFDDACDWSHQAVLRVLEQNWLKCSVESVKGLEHELEQMLLRTRGAGRPSKAGTKSAATAGKKVGSAADEDDVFELPKHFYMNLKTSKTQWVQPYNPGVFWAADIELDSFVNTVLKYDLFSRSPLASFLHIPPPDLWPNANIFLKKIQAAGLKSKRLEIPLAAAAVSAVVERENKPDTGGTHQSTSSKTRGKITGGTGKGRASREKSRRTDTPETPSAYEFETNENTEYESDVASQGEGEDWESVDDRSNGALEDVTEP